MEFFKIVNANTTEAELRELLKLEHLENYSSELISLGLPKDHHMPIGGIWGEFNLSRQEIKGGVRFSLVECPNALAWTVTTGYLPAKDDVVIHLTINRLTKEDQFLEEIQEFLEDHAQCLEQLFKTASCFTT